jgi:hypothetical protein
MDTMAICSKYKMIICSKFINQREIRLHKRFHMFQFIYYNNIIFCSFNHTLVLPLNTTHTTAKKTNSVKLISTVRSFKVGFFTYESFQTVV